MNKKIILLVAILLLVVIVFVACKTNGDVEETESTTEPTSESTTGSLLNDLSDGDESFIIPELYDPESTTSADSVIVIGGGEATEGEDSIEWNTIVGKNS